MSVIRSAPFLRAYHLFPHRAINGLARRLARARRPRCLVQALMRLWVRRDEIRLDDCAVRDLAQFVSMEDFFLRRLRADARPIDPAGLAAPVDGRLVAAGTLEADTRLSVKGRWLSVARIVNGRVPADPVPLDAYVGGSYAVLFLSPRGYHRVHAPVSGQLVDVRWVGGRFFPQNEQALARIPGVYERNERAVVRLRPAGSASDLLLVLVGASVVGGIELEGHRRADWVGPTPFALGRACARGAEIGHFTFGSTVIVFAPAGAAGDLIPAPGTDVQMGQRLWNDP
ncbi:MAG TPA: archaetidylserine decarboxylase [Polyangia bacterium]|nr:archaetidylserine decarboxylase [Polyangia bacterium]